MNINIDERRLKTDLRALVLSEIGGVHLKNLPSLFYKTYQYKLNYGNHQNLKRFIENNSEYFRLNKNSLMVEGVKINDLNITANKSSNNSQTNRYYKENNSYNFENNQRRGRDFFEKRGFGRGRDRGRFGRETPLDSNKMRVVLKDIPKSLSTYKLYEILKEFNPVNLRLRNAFPRNFGFVDIDKRSHEDILERDFSGVGGSNTKMRVIRYITDQGINSKLSNKNKYYNYEDEIGQEDWDEDSNLKFNEELEIDDRIGEFRGSRRNSHISRQYNKNHILNFDDEEEDEEEEREEVLENFNGNSNLFENIDDMLENDSDFSNPSTNFPDLDDSLEENEETKINFDYKKNLEENKFYLKVSNLKTNIDKEKIQEIFKIFKNEFSILLLNKNPPSYFSSDKDQTKFCLLQFEKEEILKDFLPFYDNIYIEFKKIKFEIINKKISNNNNIKNNNIDEDFKNYDLFSKLFGYDKPSQNSQSSTLDNDININNNKNDNINNYNDNNNNDDNNINLNLSIKLPSSLEKCRIKLMISDVVNPNAQFCENEIHLDYLEKYYYSLFNDKDFEFSNLSLFKITPVTEFFFWGSFLPLESLLDFSSNFISNDEELKLKPYNFNERRVVVLYKNSYARAWVELVENINKISILLFDLGVQMVAKSDELFTSRNFSIWEKMPFAFPCFDLKPSSRNDSKNTYEIIKTHQIFDHVPIVKEKH